VERTVIGGVIQGNVIVPDRVLHLPDGTHVQISFLTSELPQELQEEFAA